MHVFSLIFSQISQFNSLGFFSFPPRLCWLSTFCLLATFTVKPPHCFKMNPEPLKDLELLKTQRSFRHVNTGERCPKEREVPEQIAGWHGKHPSWVSPQKWQGLDLAQISFLCNPRYKQTTTTKSFETGFQVAQADLELNI